MNAVAARIATTTPTTTAGILGTNRGRALSNRHVPKLTCRSRDALVNLAIENDPRSQSLLDEYENEVAHIANLRPAQPEFGECRSVRVVVDRNRQSRSFL